ncbi:MAG: hypothetical protein KDK45_07135, partial [Leptospiraceae bacterium]|nr:hypothetical protein [Leptospiraceae bacterium]
MHKLILSILLLLPSFLVYSQVVEEKKEVRENPTQKSSACHSIQGKPLAFIEVFQLINLSREQYEVMINFHDPQERSKYVVGEGYNIQDAKVNIEIDGVSTRIASSQAIHDKIRLKLNIFSLNQVSEGWHCARITSHDKKTVLAELPFYSPERMEAPSNQPIIKKLHPSGGVAGDTIMVYGEYFGKSIDKIRIEFLTKKGENLNYWKEEILADSVPYTLSKEEDPKNDKKITEVVRFSIPGHPKLNTFSIMEWLFGKRVYIRVLVNNRPATLEKFTILNDNWRAIIIFMSLLITIVFIGTLALIIHQKQFYALIVLDTKTNMYSLSKAQAFAWLVVLLGSYFYVAICSGIILQNGKIPDFNYSLIGLMGISVGGLLTSNYLDNKDEEIKRNEKPMLIDLIRNPEGEIELPKLQLLGFTAIAILIYIFNLLQSNVLGGLPDLPSTLHTLLLTSQGGYIGGKAISNPNNSPLKKKEKNKK